MEFKIENEQIIDLFQEAFNVMVYSFNRDWVDFNKPGPILREVPVENKNVKSPDFCYATFSLNDFFILNPSILTKLKEDLYHTLLQTNHPTDNDISIFEQLKSSSKYEINFMLGERMILGDQDIDCVMLGNTCDQCINREFTSAEEDCFKCPKEVEIFSINSKKFEEIINYQSKGDIWYSYRDNEPNSDMDIESDSDDE
jgi:hypothetical protein